MKSPRNFGCCCNNSWGWVFIFSLCRFLLHLDNGLDYEKAIDTCRGGSCATLLWDINGCSASRGHRTRINFPVRKRSWRLEASDTCAHQCFNLEMLLARFGLNIVMEFRETIQELLLNGPDAVRDSCVHWEMYSILLSVLWLTERFVVLCLCS